MKNNTFCLGRYWLYQKRIAKKFWLLYAVWGAVMAICGIIHAAAPSANSEIAFALAVSAGAVVAEMLFVIDYFAKAKIIEDLMLPASLLEKYASRLIFFFAVPWLIAWGMLGIFGLYPPDHGLLFYFASCVLSYPFIIWQRWRALMLGGFLYPLTLGFEWIQNRLELGTATSACILAAEVVLAVLAGWIVFKRQGLVPYNAERAR